MMRSIYPPMNFVHERRLGRPSCPKCGVLILAPETSAYMSDGRVRHTWLCDECDYDFRTVVRVATNPVRNDASSCLNAGQP
jgi:hypothetical protein